MRCATSTVVNEAISPLVIHVLCYDHGGKFIGRNP